MERVKLYETGGERDLYEDKADLYGIIIAIERLDRAYIKDHISGDEYTRISEDLLTKCKVLYNKLQIGLDGLESFMTEHQGASQLGAGKSAVLSRIKIGVPITKEHGTGDLSSSYDSRRLILEAGQHMTTCVNTSTMGLNSADALYPILSDAVSTTAKVSPNLPELEALRNWLRIVNTLKAAEELTEDQARQFRFDVETAYGAFSKQL